MKLIRNWIKLIRVKHWIKNIIILLPLFFGKAFEGILIQKGIVTFISFSLIASAIYVFNDIVDVEKDRKHPVKCNRPIAAGHVTISAAIVGHCILLISGILVFLVSGGKLIQAIILCAVYYGINIFYTLKGKNIPLLDIVILSSGFLIRLFLGSVVTGISISEWLYLVITAGAFYLGLCKRRNELMCQEDSESNSREVLKYYNYQFLDKNMHLCLCLAIVFYSLWCMGYAEKGRYLLITVPLVLVIAMKYSLNIEKEGANGDPTDTILNDRIILLLILLLVLAIFLILYII